MALNPGSRLGFQPTECSRSAVQKETGLRSEVRAQQLSLGCTPGLLAGWEHKGPRASAKQGEHEAGPEGWDWQRVK